MALLHENADFSYLSPKVSALDNCLQQSYTNFKELQNELGCLLKQIENYKSDLQKQKEKCESQMCPASEALKRVIDAKDVIINSVASTVSKLDETKDFKFLGELFKILCGEATVSTPNKEIIPGYSKQSPSYTEKKSPETNCHITNNFVNLEAKLVNSEKNNTETKPTFLANHELKSVIPHTYYISPKKEPSEICKEESISEIEGTPTGRVSPIIESKKKLRSSSSVSSLSTNSSDSREKKKCPEDWSTPDAKLVKLKYCPGQLKNRSSSGKMRQSRLDTVFAKATSVVDLTSSPECAARNENFCSVKLLIKKESSDNDDTILPSPTSGPANLFTSKTAAKENIPKVKKPLSLSRIKSEYVYNEEINSPILPVGEKKRIEKEISDMEHSINILQPNKFQNGPKSSPMKTYPKASPKKGSTSPKKKSPNNNMCTRKSPLKPEVEPMDTDVTHFEDASISILKHVEKLEANQPELLKQKLGSPTKKPLVENLNVLNTQTNGEDSISLLKEPKTNAGCNISDTTNKRKTPEKVQPMFIEPAPRKKADKQALPAWLCDECKDVINDLYADEPEKVARIVSKCSKHRGRTNPARPKTPPGFWNPRWSVPDDTEEFNRRNNVQ